MTHELKCWPEHFVALRTGSKKFEVRRDDRVPRFELGDRLLMKEFDPRDSTHIVEGGVVVKEVGFFTGRDDEYVVTWVLRAPTVGFPKGWVVLQVEKVS